MSKRTGTPLVVSVFGAGYVGVVTAACLAEQGVAVTVVEKDMAKAKLVAMGKSPIMEPGVDERLERALEKGLVATSRDPVQAVQVTSFSIICVGTPSKGTGEIDLRFVEAVSEQIAQALAVKSSPHTLIYRSTMSPGSTRKLAAKHFASFIQSGTLQVFFVPEFMREGSAVADFFNPPLSVVGTAEGLPADLNGLEGKLFLGREITVLRWEEAEYIKYACNAFHAIKVAFANEIGRHCKAYGVDARQVMRVFCTDTKLNISPYYLRPGAPYGGSCLPKDVSGLLYSARERSVDLPVISSLGASNDFHQNLIEIQVERTGCRKICILGLSFKLNTDDLRNSPSFKCAAGLIESGYELTIFDPFVKLDKITGANKSFADRLMKDLCRYMQESAAKAIEGAEVIIVFQKCIGFEVLQRTVRHGHIIIDLVNWPELETLPARYEGICW